MARTHFQDFTKDDGAPVTVEYSVEGSYSPTTYSPMNGACGGDAPEIGIIAAWPRTEDYDRLWRRKSEIEAGPYGQTRHFLSFSEKEREDLAEIDRAIEAADKSAELTDSERERMEAWLCEHYVEDDPEPEF
jgi:hypothetical protein